MSRPQRLFDVQIEHYLIEELFASAFAIARWLIGPSSSCCGWNWHTSALAHAEVSTASCSNARFISASHNINWCLSQRAVKPTARL